jgi:hypothetical protein
MKRFGRWLFYAAAALSLLLCIGSAIAWARSYNVLYAWSRQQEHRDYTGDLEIWLDQGRLVILIGIVPQADRGQAYKPPQAHWRLYREPYWFAFRRNNTSAQFGWRFWNYDHSRRQAPPGFGPAGYWSAGINLALVAGVFAILPAIVRIRFLRKKYFQRRPGICRKCGYDLRATPDRCPECGTVPTGKEIVRI